MQMIQVKSVVQLFLVRHFTWLSFVTIAVTAVVVVVVVILVVVAVAAVVVTLV